MPFHLPHPGFQRTSRPRIGRGLAERVTLSFAILLSTVALLFSVAIVLAVGFTEEELVSSMMRDDLAYVREGLESGEGLRRLPNTGVCGDGGGLLADGVLPPVPDEFRTLSGGFNEVVSERSFFVWRGDWKGGALFIVRDQSEFEEKEQLFFCITGIVIAFVFLLGAFLGFRLSRRIMGPVERLSAAIHEASSARRWKPLPPELMTPDEVGELATICSDSMRRLHEALDRERAFSSDASHELRTPLTVIETSAELLELSDLPPRQKAQVGRILRASARMHELIETLLEFARLSCTEDPDVLARSGEHRSLGDILEESAPRWRAAAEERGLRFSIERQGECPGLHPAALLGIVLSNLVRNALRYTRTGFVRIVESPEGVAIESSGPEIGEEERLRIFRPFERGAAGEAEERQANGAESREGTRGQGLGLSIVSRITDRMGWGVALEVTSGVNIFRVRLSRKDVVRPDAAKRDR